jgi:hypothetical protein
MGAFGLDAEGRWLLNLDQLGFGEFLFVAHHAGGNDLSGGCERNEIDFAIQPRHAAPTKGYIVDGEAEKVVAHEWNGMKLRSYSLVADAGQREQ